MPSTTDASPASVSAPAEPASAEGAWLSRLAALTADGLEAVVDATLAGDRVAARRLLDASRRRRRVYAAAAAEARASLTQRSPGAPVLLGRHVMCQAQEVAELGAIGDMVDALARDVLRYGAEHVEQVAEDAVLLKIAGVRRLRHLARGLDVPALGAAYVSEGADLRRVADHLRTSQPCAAGLAYAVIAESLLSASRYATRAA